MDEGYEQAVQLAKDSALANVLSNYLRILGQPNVDLASIAQAQPMLIQVSAVSVGPQGPPGPTGATGPQGPAGTMSGVDGGLF